MSDKAWRIVGKIALWAVAMLALTIANQAAQQELHWHDKSFLVGWLMCAVTGWLQKPVSP
jgi:uncharacterized protein involved in response to NO